MFYGRFKRSKDLSSYSEQDMDQILGVADVRPERLLPRAVSASPPAGDPEQDVSLADDKDGFKTVTSTLSVLDYFRQKAAAKTGSLLQPPAANQEESEKEKEKVMDKDMEKVIKTKTKKKKTSKEEDAGYRKRKRSRESDSLEDAALSPTTQQPNDQGDAERKKKKKKRRTKEEDGEEETQKLKKKKKKLKDHSSL